MIESTARDIKRKIVSFREQKKSQSDWSRLVSLLFVTNKLLAYPDYQVFLVALSDDISPVWVQADGSVWT
jgi:hypothetical protein